jgi:hypothetical protein
LSRDDLDAAEDAFAQNLAIFEQLTKLDPPTPTGGGNWPKRAAGPVAERKPARWLNGNGA